MAPKQAQTLAKNIVLRKTLVTQISEIFEFSKIVRHDSAKTTDFLVRFDTVASLYDEFRDCHRAIIFELSTEEEMDPHDTIRKQVDEMYFNIQAVYRTIANSSSESTPSSQTTSDRSRNLKLPKIKIPLFDGSKLNEWPTFLDLFNSLIHDNESLSSIEKFHYLITSLSQEPLNLVKSVPMTAANYSIAYKSLVERYQNKRLLATNYWNILNEFPPLSSDSKNSLRHLCDTFSETLSALKALEFPVESWDFPLFNLFLSKLDPVTRKQFELAKSQVEMPTFIELKDFVSERAKALETFQAKSEQRLPSKETKQFKPKGHQQRSSFVANVSSPNLVSTCILCRAEHLLSKCSLFLTKTPSERFQFAKSNQLCLNCLRSGHSLSRCTNLGNCRSCGQRHHSLLHFISNPRPSAIPKQDTPLPQSAVVPSTSSTTDSSVPLSNPSVLTSTIATTSTVLLSTAIVDIRDRWGNFQSVRVLLDSGSQANFIAQHCLRRLGLKQTAQSIPVQGLNSSNNVSQGITTCTLKPQGQQCPQLQVQALVLPQICNQMPSVPINRQEWEHIVNLKLADPSFDKPSNIDLLLGAEFFPDILKPGLLSSSPDKPVALNTIFGWVLMGKASTQQPSPINSFHVTVEPPLRQVLQQFWELEQIPSSALVAPEDEFVENTFRTRHYRGPTGRFVVPLLLKSPSPTFVDSYSIAYRRLLALERRFATNSDLHDRYNTFMKDYLDSQHMQPLDLSSEEVHSPDCYYIPHHAVFKEENQSAKIRVVFNASSPDLEGNALNNSVFVGPKLQSDIVDILLRFRFHSVVFVADIKQMYRQLLVRPEERKYQRILWRFSSADPIQVYQLNTVTYGVSSSPYLAIRTMLQVAEDEKSSFPLASKVLSTDLYMDDLVTGCNSLHDAKILREQISTIMNSAQLILHKWSSNNPVLLKDTPLEHQQSQSLKFDNTPSSIKILGLQWHPSSDNFSYEVAPWDRPCTKRYILSELARIFDPLGFLSPLTFLAKHLIQRLWTDGFDWDDVPASEIVNCWNRYKAELPSLSYLQIPRRLIVDNWGSCRLLGFCDASSVGYSAVVYIYTVGVDGDIKTFLVCAKSKVAPLKSISIPRLELCAAVLLADLLSFVVATFNAIISFDSIIAWSDSTVALAWIRSSPHRWKPFVSNRVARIQEKLPSSHWHHVQSRDNPADCASRGLYPIELLNHPLWWYGPDWIRHPMNQWPHLSPPLSPDSSKMDILSLEERKVVLAATLSPHFLILLLDRYSSLGKIQRVAAYCLRFVHNLRNPMSKGIGTLTSLELHRSLEMLVKLVQAQVFIEDIRRLQSQSPCSKQLRKLNPFLDPSGILRVGGRIRHSDLDFEAKHPALLPRNHRLTELIIEDAHQRYLHPGLKTLHYLLRQNFWILSAYRAIRHSLSRCIRCFRVKPSSVTPQMGDLPSFRVSQVKPFLHVGLDYAGPFKITMGKHRGAKATKAYLCLFVCMATKALHLELVSDLTSDACLAALRRFIARRGRCSHLYSDCGTNFVGVSKELVTLFENSASQEHISWSFNPPSAPNFGGLWEAGVKSVKSHLLRVIGDQILTFEELQTIFVQIEALLNSRPLCELSSDPTDLSPLTPGHFLTLAPLSTIPDPDFSSLNINRLGRWQLLQRLHADFWKRWHLEYLHTLQQRHKWDMPSPPLSSDILVVIKDETAPPMHWRLGRIEKLIAGKDGIARVALVRTAKGVLKRPLTKLCPLPIY